MRTSIKAEYPCHHACDGTWNRDHAGASDVTSLRVFEVAEFHAKGTVQVCNRSRKPHRPTWYTDVANIEPVICSKPLDSLDIPRIRAMRIIELLMA
nr:hypothetical protein [Mesorhizobium sp. AR02]